MDSEDDVDDDEKKWEERDKEVKYSVNWSSFVLWLILDATRKKRRLYKRKLYNPMRILNLRLVKLNIVPSNSS